ncbi:MAG: hypothetical protein ACFFCM_14120 [Promethearchaeota archaeon]
MTSITSKQEMKLVWFLGLSTTEKITFLKNHFSGKLDTLTFWELYKFVKRLHS